MVSLIFSNVAIDLMKSWDQLNSKTLMLKAPVFRYPSSFKISESTQSNYMKWQKFMFVD